MLTISEGVSVVPKWRLENSLRRCLNFIFSYRRKNGCNCLKHNYHYGMTRAVFMNRLKKHINIGGTNHVAYAEAALIKVFINTHIENDTLIINCFILIRTSKTLDHAQN